MTRRAAALPIQPYDHRLLTDGQVAEWLKAHAWNACIRETVSRVRIPLCPPSLFRKPLFSNHILAFVFCCPKAHPNYAFPLPIRTGIRPEALLSRDCVEDLS